VVVPSELVAQSGGFYLVH